MQRTPTIVIVQIIATAIVLGLLLSLVLPTPAVRAADEYILCPEVQVQVPEITVCPATTSTRAMRVIEATSGIDRTPSAELSALARTRVTEMRNGQYGGGHRDLHELSDARWAWWGEILGYNKWTENYAASVQFVMDGWMSSPTHREIVMAPQYLYIGCAVIASAPSHYQYACIFGEPVQEQEIGTAETVQNPDFALPDTAMAVQ